MKSLSSLMSNPLQKISGWVNNQSTTHKPVYSFSEGSADDKMLLGNKGSLLCEMTRMGLPVPPGFVISTEACNEYFHNGRAIHETHIKETMRHVHELEAKTKMTFGGKLDDPKACPLLLSVRSGAAVSMPGMMDTILNLGINDRVFQSLLGTSGNPRFCYDVYRRFLQMYGTVVLGISNKLYEAILDDAKVKRGVHTDAELMVSDLEHVLTEFKLITPVPEDPFEQLKCAVEAVFSSWFSPRAVKYRDIHGISNDLGTAVTIQSMVYGNMNNLSGSGVAFTRNPVNGENVFYGEYLDVCEGEDVVSGARTPKTLEYLQEKMPAIYEQLVSIRNKLERHFKNMQDIEFTIESGDLYILQTRNGKRTAKAAVCMAVDMVREGLITEREALMRIEPAQLDFFLHDMIDNTKVMPPVICRGLPASPGCATGIIVFKNADAEACRNAGQKCILCREETSADDIGGLYAANGVMTMRGGMTSHAAVVARGMGKTAITGVGSMGEVHIDVEKELIRCHDGTFLRKGDLITLDGSSGIAYLGAVQTMPAARDLNYQTIIQWADKYKVMGVYANAETPEDVAKAAELGAEGLGLCRTEHMFFSSPARLNAMRAMILAATSEDRKIHLAGMLPFQQQDFLAIYKSFPFKVVTVRFLDPPLHEFLPVVGTEKYTEEVIILSEMLGITSDQCEERIASFKETNPMLGFRGCRLSVIHPEITEMQATAALGAAIEAEESGIYVKLKLMIPLVSTDHEIEEIAPTIRAVAQKLFAAKGKTVVYELGTMIEVPRACIRADAIVTEGDVGFVSFGTNDLTQMTYGFSRDDSDRFLPYYIQKKILSADPFATIDVRGVGSLMALAVQKIRRTSVKVDIGVCGEHAGDPKSIEFFESLGVQYISVSPFRVPIAKIAAAKAHLLSVEESHKSKPSFYFPMAMASPFMTSSTV